MCKSVYSYAPSTSHGLLHVGATRSRLRVGVAPSEEWPRASKTARVTHYQYHEPDTLPPRRSGIMVARLSRHSGDASDSIAGERKGHCLPSICQDPDSPR